MQIYESNKLGFISGSQFGRNFSFGSLAFNSRVQTTIESKVVVIPTYYILIISLIFFNVRNRFNKFIKYPVDFFLLSFNG